MKIYRNNMYHSNLMQHRLSFMRQAIKELASQHTKQTFGLNFEQLHTSLVYRPRKDGSHQWPYSHTFDIASVVTWIVAAYFSVGQSCLSLDHLLLAVCLLPHPQGIRLSVAGVAALDPGWVDRRSQLQPDWKNRKKSWKRPKCACARELVVPAIFDTGGRLVLRLRV